MPDATRSALDHTVPAEAGPFPFRCRTDERTLMLVPADPGIYRHPVRLGEAAAAALPGGVTSDSRYAR